VESLRAALGVVSRVDDPERLGRIRVTLPGYSDVESEWLHVLSPGAGKDKGLMALPDVDDRVLVLFPGETMGPGVVLGGLYGMAGPPDSGVEGGSVRRYTLRLPGGQYLRLDDQGQNIRLENSAGSYVELAPDKVVLHAATDMDIEAPGRTVRVRAERIDFERA
jgi:phage baseplate assembly protein gpV